MYFRRGMVELLAIKDFKSFSKNLDAIKKYGIASYIDFVEGIGKSFDLMSQLDFVRGVTFFQQESDGPLKVLEAMASREKLRALSINESSLGEKEIQQLTQLDMPSLRALDLHFNSLGDCLESLYRWPAASQLHWLNIDLNDFGGRHANITTEHILEFAGQKSLANLFSLSIAANSLAPIHMQAFSENAVMKRLTQLDLSSNPIEDDGIAAITKGGFKSLNILELSTTKITDEAVGLIAASSNMASLRRLNIGHNSKISDPSLASIASSEYLGNLTHLNLARTGIGEAGAKALIDSETLVSMRHLNIGSAELSAPTLKALQKRYPRAVVKNPYD